LGDRSSTAITFVSLVTLIGIFVVLAGSIPEGFYEVAPDYQETKTRDEWFPNEDIGFMNYTDSENLTKGQKHYLQIGDIYVDIYWDYYPYITDIWFLHTWQVSFWWDHHLFDDTPITLQNIIDHQTEDFANRSYMVLTCPCPKTYYVYFIYNSTEYSSWSEAWDGGELEVYVGMGWNDAIEKMNAWSLIWNVLTFQAPEVFGTGAAANVMNAIIAIPLWASFAIIGAIMILWFIPFLGGE